MQGVPHPGVGQDVGVSTETQQGIVFPLTPGGRRSTSALGRAVVADALRRVDPVGARAAEQDTNWRSGYLEHFRRLVEAGLGSRGAALSVAPARLPALHDPMRVGIDADADVSDELRLADWSPSTEPATAEVQGTGRPEIELSLPYRGQRLRGPALGKQLAAWVAAGVMEPSAAEAIRTVAADPESLRLDGRTVV